MLGKARGVGGARTAVPRVLPPGGQNSSVQRGGQQGRGLTTGLTRGGPVNKSVLRSGLLDSRGKPGQVSPAWGFGTDAHREYLALSLQRGLPRFSLKRQEAKAEGLRAPGCCWGERSLGDNRSWCSGCHALLRALHVLTYFLLTTPLCS